MTKIAEYKAYIESQNEIILKLSGEVELYKAKLNSLKTSEKQPSTLISSADASDMDEAICEQQLGMLHELSLGRSLTMEEAKKFEIFTKLLLSLKARPKKQENPAQQLSDDELLSNVVGINEKK